MCRYYVALQILKFLVFIFTVFDFPENDSVEANDNAWQLADPPMPGKYSLQFFTNLKSFKVTNKTAPHIITCYSPI